MMNTILLFLIFLQSILNNLVTYRWYIFEQVPVAESRDNTVI